MVFIKFDLLEMFSLVSRGGGSHKKLLIISVISSAVVFALPFDFDKDILAVNRTLQFFPFFCLGHFLRTIDTGFLKSTRVRSALILLSIILLIMIGLFDSRVLHLLCFRRSGLLSIAKEMHLEPANILLLKSYVEISGVVISLCVLSLSEFFKQFAFWGKDTMTIFIVQALLTHLITYKIPVSIYLELALSVVVIIAGVLVSNKGYGKLLRNPFSSFIKSRI